MVHESCAAHRSEGPDDGLQMARSLRPHLTGTLKLELRAKGACALRAERAVQALRLGLGSRTACLIEPCSQLSLRLALTCSSARKTRLPPCSKAASWLAALRPREHVATRRAWPLAAARAPGADIAPEICCLRGALFVRGVTALAGFWIRGGVIASHAYRGEYRRP